MSPKKKKKEESISLYGDGIGAVEYVSHMGDDLTIVNSARVSFGVEKDKLDVKDEKLIRYLIKHKHTSTSSILNTPQWGRADISESSFQLFLQSNFLHLMFHLEQKLRVTRHAERALLCIQHLLQLVGKQGVLLFVPKVMAVLSHALNDRLVALLIPAKPEGRVLLRKLDQTVRHLLQVALGLGLDGNLDHGVGEVHLLQDDRVVRRADRVTREGVLQADHRDDLPCTDLVEGIPILGVHLEDPRDVLLAVRRGVEDT